MNLLLSFFEILNKGGSVAWCLAGFSFLLWYALGYRFLNLKTACLKYQPQNISQNTLEKMDDSLSLSLLKIKKIHSEKYHDRDLAIESVRHNFVASLSSYRQTIGSIVIVAPLLGLLGTVIGMIETFDSLQDSALFSQSGGIAGGISQALITTQMGLVVAIPGLLIGKKLDKKQDRIMAFLDLYIGFLELHREKNETAS